MTESASIPALKPPLAAGTGLAVLGDAVAHVGGTWAISSVESGGTTLRVEVPLT